MPHALERRIHKHPKKLILYTHKRRRAKKRAAAEFNGFVVEFTSF